MIVIFLLGFFLDFIEIAVVVVPIIAPILLAETGANVTAVWLGVMIGVNLQTSFLTPPFGFALFYLKGVAPKVVQTLDIWKGVVPFIILQLVALGIVGAFPTLVNYLPNRFYLSSFNAPPPMNPRLESCVESYLEETFITDEEEITLAINNLKKIDLSILPTKVSSKIDDAHKVALTVFAKLSDVIESQKVLVEATKSYAKTHT